MPLSAVALMIAFPDPCQVFLESGQGPVDLLPIRSSDGPLEIWLAALETHCFGSSCHQENIIQQYIYFNLSFKAEFLPEM